ncbi:hypothetical protein OEZ85_004234 [Tetradesmus obliquus]|uniref:Uncharacterized protein n=1 Tax=Tetradesmus obliquus TaxID=3088 RepID=A0ABY8UQI7_TETOB|nr:hypothetical protein OEZ85_004234 [Tetradesmus obliquus]
MVTTRRSKISQNQPEEACQNLEMDGAHLARRADALHLTALTSLTGLELWDAAGVDDAAACALALRLKRLQKLNLFDCGLRSAAALPSIATLTGLTGLWLSVSSSMPATDFPLGRDELLLLAPLTKLKTLDCGCCFSRAAVDELWDEELERWRPQQQI